MFLNLAKSVIDIEIKALKLLKNALGPQFNSVVLTLNKTKGRIIVSGMGKSGHVAKKISSTFSSIGSPSFFIHPAEANHGDLGMITKSDVVLLISNSGETIELINIILHCKKLRVPIIAFTSEKFSTLAKKVIYLLKFQKTLRHVLWNSPQQVRQL